MVILDEKITDILNKTNGCLVEIAGLPDSGSTSAAIKILDTFLEKNKDEEIFCGFLSNNNNQLQLNYVSQLLQKGHDNRIVLVGFNNGDDLSFLNLMKELSSEIKIWIIDDFYNFILHKKFTKIRDIMKALRLIVNSENIKIIFINQYRNVINNSEYSFNNYEEVKTLYSEHIDNFLDYKLKVEKNESDINVNLIKDFSKPKTTLLEDLLQNFL